jgi:hypothetical protein
MPSKFDHRTFVRFDHGTPEHPKVVAMSDAAFRAWFEAICWSSRQERNGIVPKVNMLRLTRPKVIAELLRIGSLSEHADGYEVHDYLDFQRSKEEIDAFRSAKGDAGTLGNHKRWHVARRRFDSDCEHCKEEGRIAIAK